MDDTIRSSPIDIINGPFTMLRLRATARIPPHAVATFRDDTELTVVVPRELALGLNDVMASEGPFSLLRFRVAIPFLVEGFLAAIARTLADVHINVLIWSTFSYDYAFVRTTELDHAVNALSKRGFPEGHRE